MRVECREAEIFEVLLATHGRQEEAGHGDVAAVNGGVGASM